MLPIYAVKKTVVEAIEEALRIGREARISVQISHLKTMGEKNWHKLPR